MKQLFSLFTLLFTLFIFSACSSSSDSSSSNGDGNDISDDIPISNEDTRIPSKYYGTWSYIDNAQTINILSSSDIEITEIENDDDLLIIIENENERYIVRSGLATTTVNGILQAVVNPNLSPSKSPSANRASSFSGIGNINIILSNVLDANIKEETHTRNDGSFTTTTLPTGTYNLEATDDVDIIETTVEIVNKDNDIGVYKLTGSDLNNFKAELILNDKYILSNSKTFEGVLRVHNISNKIGYGLSYDINMTSTDKVINFTEKSEDALGSVAPKSYKDIPVSFAFNTLDTNEKIYGLEVQISDALGNKWLDTFNFTVNKDTIAILISTKSANIKGIIKNPSTGEVTEINTEDGKIILPLMPEGKPYIMILSNPSFETETAYSIGINTEPLSFTGFKNTAAHEPNNNFSNSNSLTSNSTARSYLHGTDVDYWEIYTAENTLVNNALKEYKNPFNDSTPSAPTSAPLNVSASDGTSKTDILVSWSSVSNTTYYELYEATSSNGTYAKIQANLNITNYNVTNAIDGTEYFYKLKACNDTGCSIFSSINSGYLEAPIPNIIPTVNAGADQNITKNTSITLNASANDDDSDNATLSYRWLENSVVLSTSVNLTHTFTMGIHEIAIVVTDSDGATATDTVIINAINTPPVFISSQDMNITENTHAVGSIGATDGDDDSLVYALVSGDTAGLSINSLSGLLQFNNDSYPDFETKDSYSLIVSVSDGTDTVEQNLTINVNDVLDVKPSIVGTLSIDVAENTTPAIIGNLSITRGDSDTISVTILSNTKFKIAMNGDISLKSGETLDFETQNTYSFYVKATNTTGDSNLGLVNINITNIIEPPFITTKTIKVQESFDVGVLGLTNEDGQTVTMSIVDDNTNDSDKFAINPTLGNLIFNNLTKFDAPVDADANNTYELQIELTTSLSGVIYEDITVEVEPIVHNGTTYSYVESPTSRIWLDRNLGAVDANGTDADYYQWGRGYDGHQDSTSNTDTTAIDVDDTSFSGFIGRYDWATGDMQGDTRRNKWSSTDGSSICPVGFRVPNMFDFSNEIANINNIQGAKDSFLNLGETGFRSYTSGQLYSTSIYLWSYEVSSSDSRKANVVFIDNKGYVEKDKFYGNGFQVRCIKH